MLTLPEEILLLLLDDESGRFLGPGLSTRLVQMEPGSGRLSRSYALAGAVLMELALRSRIDADRERLVLVDATPTGERLLDHYLERIAAEPEQSTREWVSTLSVDGPDIEATALDRLVERGILRREEKRVLWVFKQRRYPMIDGVEEREVRARILELLRSDEIPSPHDAELVCLIEMCSLFPEILGRDEAERLGPRIDRIRRLDLIGQAVSESLEQLRIELAKAMTPPYA